MVAEFFSHDPNVLQISVIFNKFHSQRRKIDKYVGMAEQIDNLHHVLRRLFVDP